MSLDSSCQRQSVDHDLRDAAQLSKAEDSGYSSQATSPEIDKHKVGEELDLCATTSIFHKVKKLKVFEKEIPISTWNRFNDLRELFDKPLYEHIAKSRMSFTAIAIRLKILGQSELSSKPWIVVTCDESISKRVKQFFRKTSIRAEYQPRQADSDLPDFELLVYAVPPKLKAAHNIYRESFENSEYLTLCGMKICTATGNIRRATMGGVVMIEYKGAYHLYGMTVGHILPLQQHAIEQATMVRGNGPIDSLDHSSVLGPDIYESQSLPDEEHLFSQTDEEFKLDLDSGESDFGDEEEMAIKQSSEKSDNQAQSILRMLGRPCSLLGKINVPSWDHVSDKRNLDYALVELDSRNDYRENFVAASEIYGFRGGELKARSARFNENPIKRSVIILNDAKVMKAGVLSTSISSILIAPGEGFVDTYCLVLSDGLVIESGDCGSWVVDVETIEVYGHVIASDVFGEVHVVPLEHSFRHMKSATGSSSVSLPSSTQVRWFTDQSPPQIKLGDRDFSSIFQDATAVDISEEYEQSAEPLWPRDLWSSSAENVPVTLSEAVGAVSERSDYNNASTPEEKCHTRGSDVEHAAQSGKRKKSWPRKTLRSISEFLPSSFLLEGRDNDEAVEPTDQQDQSSESDDETEARPHSRPRLETPPPPPSCVKPESPQFHAIVDSGYNSSFPTQNSSIETSPDISQ